MTPERKQKIESVLSKRQPTLHVVLENVDDPHNVGAVLRSCEAFGVVDVHLLYYGGNARGKTQNAKSSPRMPRLGEIRSTSAASALKWLRINKWDSVKKMVAHFKKEKITIVTTHMSAKAIDASQADLSSPVAIVLGNEHDGVSPALLKASKVNVLIPMVGFVQSFNISVAGSLMLYEAYRQREKKGMYAKEQMKKGERGRMMKKWSGDK
ncbi:MAG: RNA methyltransferase [Candidatus Uhrbacteria bacterium]